MTINGKAISAEEFLYIYEKNNQAGAVDPKTMDEYLDMFINFKLKVAEAESQGIDTTESFKKELKGYRAQATPKYLQDEAIPPQPVALLGSAFERKGDIFDKDIGEVLLHP